ncbi:MAG: hypothetical protein PHI68_00405 [Candidatus Cloacimonetes bacterium]|nr:hypothetical protein [Candidatus Cloacimonadota bacterium]
MKNLWIMIGLVVIVFAPLFAEESRVLSLNFDNMKLSQLPAIDHDINVLVSKERNRIYFSDEFKVLKSDLATQDLKIFFLNRDLIVDKMSVNGVDYPINLIENLRPEHFNPPLRLQTMVNATQFSNVYSIFVPDNLALPDTVNLKLKYILATDKEFQYSEQEESHIRLRGQNFWYPRNLHKDESVILKVSASSKHKVEIQGVELGYELANFRRISRLSFLDKSNQPADFKLIEE